MKGMGVDIFIATPGKSYTMTADVENGAAESSSARVAGLADSHST